MKESCVAAVVRKCRAVVNPCGFLLGVPLVLALGCSPGGLQATPESPREESQAALRSAALGTSGTPAAQGTSSVTECLANWRLNSPCGAYCLGQTQADLKNCKAFLDCYKNNNCGPTTCGGPDQTCGVNVVWPRMGSSPKNIADLVYECMACPGTTPTTSCSGKINTTPCTDGDACTSSDKCMNNACVSGSPVSCTALDQCHVAGTCSPATGCSNPSKPDSSPCDDGNVCTAGDTCQSGSCVAGPLASPSGLSATGGDGQIVLSWTPFTGATTYSVKRSTSSGGPYLNVASVSSAAYTDTGLSCGITYYYVVTASASCGETASSNEVSATCTTTLPPPQGILTPTTTPPAFTPPSRDPVLQSQTVTVDIATLLGSQNQVLGLNLFPDAQFHVVGVRIERNGPNGWVWVGQAENQPHSLVTLSIRNGIISGNIFAKQGDSWHTYKIRFAGNGVYAVQEAKVQAAAADCVLDGDADSGAGGEPDGPVPCNGVDTGESIDAMIGYTTAVRNKLGGADAAEALAYESVAAANQSYLNSGINTRLRIVDVREYSFAETGSMTNDDVSLRQRSGGFSGVSAVRDASGADVIVMLVDEGPGAPCGASPTPSSTVSTSRESYANSCVQYDCAAASAHWSLAHEVGHQMYGRHDWYKDSADNSPYHYNHGFVDMTNTFYSMMAYPDKCEDSGITTCQRIPYWSNPSVQYNGHPTGVADNGTNPQPSDMTRTVNNVASTLANYRCSSPDITTVWMRDTWDDTGKEPDPATANEDMFESPYVWVRNEQDADRIHQHEHQNPVYGQANWVYVKLHNGGAADQAGTLNVYFANASSGLAWPQDWTLIDSPALTVDLHSTQVAEIEWPSLPGTGHYCLLARWVSTADPPTEGSDIETNVRNNNNIIWHNVNIVNGSGEEKDASFDMLGRNQVYALQVAPSPAESNGSFLLYGHVVIELAPAALASWLENGRLGHGFQFDEETGRITVSDPAGAVLEGMVLPWVGYWPGVYPVELRITRPTTTPARTFHLQALQYVQAPVGEEPRVSSTVDPSYVRVGGVTYELTP